MSKSNKNIKMVVQSDSDNDQDSNISNDSDMESEPEQVIEKKIVEPIIEKKKEIIVNKETDDKSKKTPAKRKTKKESNNLILDTILSLIENENKLNTELSQIKNSLNEKEKEIKKNSEDKNKLITKYFEKTNKKSENKSTSASSNSPPKEPSGFAKPMTVTKYLHKFLELDKNISEQSMIELSSLLSSKLKKEDKKYVLTDQNLKDLNTSINYIKENINEKALKFIEFNDNHILIPHTYLKSLITLLLNLK